MAVGFLLGMRYTVMAPLIGTIFIVLAIAIFVICCDWTVSHAFLWIVILVFLLQGSYVLSSFFFARRR